MKSLVLDSGFLRQLHGRAPMSFDPATLAARFGDAIAPNGCLASENFGVWFGHSRVVDELGAPLIVIHGTKGDFTAFQTGHGNAESQGFLFAPKECLGYIWSFLDATHEEGRSNFFMPVYLSIQRPMFWDTTDTGAWACPVSENEQIAEAKKQGCDGLIIRDREYQTTFYVAFEATQIKSAVGNSGDFDAYSEDIVDAHSWEWTVDRIPRRSEGLRE